MVQFDVTLDVLVSQIQDHWKGNLFYHVYSSPRWHFICMDGFKRRCDVAASNVSIVKTTTGVQDAYRNSEVKYMHGNVLVTVLYVHVLRILNMYMQLKDTINALYSSQRGRTKSFLGGWL